LLPTRCPVMTIRHLRRDLTRPVEQGAAETRDAPRCDAPVVSCAEILDPSRGSTATRPWRRPSIYDMATRQLVEAHPIAAVRLYVCGITPYDATHIGHAATYLAYDTLCGTARRSIPCRRRRQVRH